MQDWTKDFYNHFYLDSYLPLLPPERTTREVDALVQALGLQPGERILDLACGHGRHTLELARRGFASLLGLDFSREALEKARADAEGQGLSAEFQQGDMRKLEFEAEFDAVYNYFSAMFYWDDATHLQILRGIHKALKLGGRLLIETVNRENVLRLGPRQSWGPGAGEVAWRLHDVKIDLERSRTFTREVLVLRDGHSLERHFETQLYTLKEVIGLLEAAGLTYQKSYGGPDLSPYRADSPRMIVAAAKEV